MRINLRFHQDDRGTRYCDVFPEIKRGDINVTIVEPGACALWHRHRRQDDYQFVIKGSLKIGMCNTPSTESEILKESDSKQFLRDNFIHDSIKEWEDEYSVYTRDSILCHYDHVSQAKIKNDLVNSYMEKWKEPNVEWHYMSEKSADQGALFIPRGLWHGCYNYTNEPAILIYHITNKYDGSDEDRMDVNHAGWAYEREAK